MNHPTHARFLVRLHYGRTAIPSRYFETYQSARRYARSLPRASVRLLLTEGEARALYTLAVVSLFAFAIRALGA